MPTRKVVEEAHVEGVNDAPLDATHVLHPELLSRVAQEMERLSPQERKERIFLTVIFDRLLTLVRDDLLDIEVEDPNGGHHHFTEQDLDVFEETLEGLEDEEIKSVLAIPKVLRKRVFGQWLIAVGQKQGEEREDAVRKMVKAILESQVRFGATLGYHVSDKSVEPSGVDWVIQGTELDDRDDMKMAYYSLDYENFYRKKPASQLYFVRAETGERSSHRRDQNGKWGRATQLAIVDQISLREVDGEVSELLELFRDVPCPPQQRRNSGTG